MEALIHDSDIEKVRRTNPHLLDMHRFKVGTFNHYLSENDPMQDYDPSVISESVLHNGQRKLLMGLLFFLKRFSRDGDIVFYAGGGSSRNGGFNVTIASELFPKVKFYLFDLEFGDAIISYSKSYPDRVEIRRELVFATDELKNKQIKEFSGRDILFLSDIRIKSKLKGDPVIISNDQVYKDMQLQMEMVKKLKPRMAMLKFKLPFSLPNKNLFYTEYEYLDGELWQQPWNKQSDEARLITDGKQMKIYSPMNYEDQMVYFHNNTRMFYYEHDVKGYDHCYDCKGEIEILGSIGNVEELHLMIDEKMGKSIFPYVDAVKHNKWGVIVDTDRSYNTLHVMAIRNDQEAYNKFLQSETYKADLLESEDKKGNIPFILAIERGHFEIAYMLSPNKRNYLESYKTKYTLLDTFSAHFNTDIRSLSLVRYLMTDSEGIKSITRFNYWKQIKSFIVAHIANINDMMITDMFSSIGGDVINLSSICSFVQGIELNKFRYYYAVNNLSVYGIKNASMSQGDSIDKVPHLEQDILYMDPPWGTIGIKNPKDIEILINGRDVLDIASDMLNRNYAKHIILKLPPYYVGFDKLQKMDYIIKERNITKREGKVAIKCIIMSQRYPYRTGDKDNHILMTDPHLRERLHLKTMDTIHRGLFTKWEPIDDFLGVIRTVAVNAKDETYYMEMEFMAGNPNKRLGYYDMSSDADIILMKYEPNITDDWVIFYEGEWKVPIFASPSSVHCYMWAKKGSKLIEHMRMNFYLDAMSRFHNNYRSQNYGTDNEPLSYDEKVKEDL